MKSETRARWRGGPLPFETNADAADVTLDGHPLRLAHLDRVYFPEDGLTKGDLLAYYYRVAAFLLPFTRLRPLNLERLPEGIHGTAFFQKQVPKNVPAWLPTASIWAEESKRNTQYVVGDNEATLLYVANLGSIALHPWTSKATAPQSPDYVVFDIDPSTPDWTPDSVPVALALRDALVAAGLAPSVKTSGKTGLHVVAPIRGEQSYTRVQAFAEMIAREITRKVKNVTLERDVSERPASSIYLDYLQNAEGKTLAAPFSCRPVVGAAVATPLTWSELETLPLDFHPRVYNIVSLAERLRSADDPFAGLLAESRPLPH